MGIKVKHIIDALESFGGEAHLDDIVVKVCELAPLPHPKDPGASIRARLQERCSEARSYQGSDDLFESVHGLEARQGIWRLKARSAPSEAVRNPRWRREEVLLVLDLYHRHGGRDPGVDHPDLIEISEFLRQMAKESGMATFRNPNGVGMKMMNFRSLDPAWTSKGGAGLRGASKLDRAVWAEFHDKPQDLAVVVEALREGIIATMDDDAMDEVLSYRANEGRVSYRLHRTLERDRKVIALRKALALKLHGKLECEACDFDFNATYGARGRGYIEAHHANPIHAMVEGDETAIEDLVLLCSNCHRMVHTAKPWLTLGQLRALLGK